MADTVEEAEEVRAREQRLGLELEIKGLGLQSLGLKKIYIQVAGLRVDKKVEIATGFRVWDVGFRT